MPLAESNRRSAAFRDVRLAERADRIPAQLVLTWNGASGCGGFSVDAGCFVSWLRRMMNGLMQIIPGVMVDPELSNSA